MATTRYRRPMCHVLLFVVLGCGSLAAVAANVLVHETRAPAGRDDLATHEPGRTSAKSSVRLLNAAVQDRARATGVAATGYSNGADAGRGVAMSEPRLQVAARHGHGVSAKFLHAAPNAEFERIVGTALRRLLERPNGFVVIEHSRSRKFVQFATTSDRGLLLDVPRQSLSPDDDVRAAAFFADRGMDAASEGPLLDPQTGAQVGIQRSFQVLLGSDVETAAVMTVEFFEQVYGIKPPEAIRLIEE